MGESLIIPSSDAEQEAMRQKLKKYEDMHQAVKAEFEKVCKDLQALKEQGKNKSVTFQQLLAQKMTLNHILSRFEIYGL